MFPGSGMGTGSMGSLGGGMSSSGCTGPFCTQSTSKYLQQWKYSCNQIVPIMNPALYRISHHMWITPSRATEFTPGIFILVGFVLLDL